MYTLQHTDHLILKLNVNILHYGGNGQDVAPEIELLLLRGQKVRSLPFLNELIGSLPVCVQRVEVVHETTDIPREWSLSPCTVQ